MKIRYVVVGVLSAVLLLAGCQGSATGPIETSASLEVRNITPTGIFARCDERVAAIDITWEVTGAQGEDVADVFVLPFGDNAQFELVASGLRNARSFRLTLGQGSYVPAAIRVTVRNAAASATGEQRVSFPMPYCGAPGVPGGHHDPSDQTP